MATTTWEPVAREYDPLKAGSIDGTDTVPHDHGIVRAMNAIYKPNKLVVGDPKATLFVGRLNPSTREDTLKKIFSAYGEIKKLRLIRDIVTGYSKGYAFIEYEERYDARKAQRSLNHSVIDDKEILVDAECERTLPGWIPRRLGGGLSGKKESGQLRFGGQERPFKRPLIIQNSGDTRHDRNSHHNRHFTKDRKDDFDRKEYRDRHHHRYDSSRSYRDRDYSKHRHSGRYDSARYEHGDDDDDRDRKHSVKHDSEKHEHDDSRDYKYSSKYDSDQDRYSNRHDYEKNKH